MRVDDVELTGGNQECLPMGMVNGRSEIEDMQQSSAPTVAATSLGLTEQVSAAPATLKEELTATRSNTEAEQICSNKLEMCAMAAELSKTAGALETGKEALLVVPSADCHVDLSEWLPPDICATYIKKGLRKLYPWQVHSVFLSTMLSQK
jgi:imidazolonepropionase-like amidohydrolase